MSNTLGRIRDFFRTAPRTISPEVMDLLQDPEASELLMEAVRNERKDKTSYTGKATKGGKTIIVERVGRQKAGVKKL